MTHDDAQAIIDELDDILEQERGALLSGDLDAIGALLDRKTGLIDALNAMETDERAQLHDLQSKVARNQALLDGALQGIRQVSARIAAFRRTRKTLETYDRAGRKHTIEGEILRKVEKRA